MQSYLWVWLLGAPAVVALVDLFTMKGATTHRT
jgi:hypothetical protein